MERMDCYEFRSNKSVEWMVLFILEQTTKSGTTKGMKWMVLFL